MPQGGGRSEWQRLQAAQRRDAERRARERAKLAKEAHLASQQQAVEDKTAELDRQIRGLDGVLTDSLPCPTLNFQQLKITPDIPRFDPGPLGAAIPEPEWIDYAPIEPKG